MILSFYMNRTEEKQYLSNVTETENQPKQSLPSCRLDKIKQENEKDRVILAFFYKISISAIQSVRNKNLDSVNTS